MICQGMDDGERFSVSRTLWLITVKVQLIWTMAKDASASKEPGH
jgi:hypothetical protein